MKNLFNKLFFSKGALITYMVLSSISAVLNYSLRFGYVFIDNALFEGFSFALFVIAVVNCALLFCFAALKMKNSDICDKKAFRIVQCISEIFAIIFTVIVLVNFLVTGKESTPVALKLLKEILPFSLAVLGIAFTIFIVPNIEKKSVQKGISVFIAISLAFALYSALFPTTPYKFTSAPTVFDNGSEYSVVFTTNDKGTAYIEYEYNGETVRRYDADNGRKNADTIHTIKVAYEELSGNRYKVFSTRVIDELSYGGRSGKTIESQSIAFNDNIGDNANILTVSDWHTFNEKAKQAASYLGNYNAVILLGDCAPGLMCEQEVEDYLISFAGDLSRGEMPVLFARGNHETRGREASNLSSYLGIDSFYYTANLGSYNFIVLDSGEDKKDDHPEYGGMVAYEQNRKDMVDWLEGLENSENLKTIVISHDKDICIEENLSARAHDKLDQLNASLLVSGHTHTSEFIENSPYPILIDGGINAAGKGTYVASVLSVSQDRIDITSVTSEGETTISKTVYWR